MHVAGAPRPRKRTLRDVMHDREFAIVNREANGPPSASMRRFCTRVTLSSYSIIRVVSACFVVGDSLTESSRRAPDAACLL